MVRNLQAFDEAMGNRELEPTDEDETEKKCLCEEDLADQRIFKLDEKTELKDPTCSICLNEIMARKEEPEVLVCELTCGHTFHA